MKTSQILIGIIGGAAIGATLGVLFAPDKGSNTRKKIIQKTTESADDLNEIITNFVDSITEKCNSIINKGKELTEKGMEDVELKNIKNINKELGN